MADNLTVTENGQLKKPESPNIIFVGFADNKVPEIKDVSSRDWWLFGTNNLFPEHLLYLYNKSSNHAAIVNGKVKYITGNGFKENFKVNPNETINKLLRKVSTDIEIFGGFYLQVSWLKGQGNQVTHLDFVRLRKDKNGLGYWYSKDWKKYTRKENEPVLIPYYDPSNKKGNQIFCYSEYRPGCDQYPLPGYFSAANDIETDAEISKYNLSTIKNGMFGGKMITFHTGDPGEESKRALEKGLKDKFAGAENSGKMMVVFGTKPELDPTVEDMSTTDLDKLFDQLNKTTQAEIFSGHEVTSPMLFGVMEPGKLGGRSELEDSYEIFKNTYINYKQMDLEEIVDYLGTDLGWTVGQKLIPVSPLNTKLNPTDFKDMLPKQWVLDKIGIDPDEYPEASNVSGVPAAQTMINEHLKGLSGKENYQLLRVIRQYKKGTISRAMAETMLGKGFNLSPEDVNTFLSFAKIDEEEFVAEMFSEVGVPRETVTIVKSRPFKFGQEEFADINQIDSNILDLIKKDKRITPEVIAETLKESVEYVKSRINSLRERKVIRTKEVKIGEDLIQESHVVPENIGVKEKPETVNMTIKYSYEVKPSIGPSIIPGSRPFCRKLIELDRLYTRAEIESISQRVGYSVWDRKGGFWNDGGDIKDECRHQWVSNIVITRK